MKSIFFLIFSAVILFSCTEDAPSLEVNHAEKIREVCEEFLESSMKSPLGQTKLEYGEMTIDSVSTKKKLEEEIKELVRDYKYLMEEIWKLPPNLEPQEGIVQFQFDPTMERVKELQKEIEIKQTTIKEKQYRLISADSTNVLFFYVQLNVKVTAGGTDPIDYTIPFYISKKHKIIKEPGAFQP